MYIEENMHMDEENNYEVSDYTHLTKLLFEKSQHLPPFSWSMVDPALCFTTENWSDESLQKLKHNLNKCKSQLNDLNLEEWSAHTRKRNPAGEVGWRVRQVINPEFLTQAWTKFYECAFRYKIVPEEAVRDNKLVSLHLCEAPGAFIASLNHYLRLHHEGIEVGLYFFYVHITIII